MPIQKQNNASNTNMETMNQEIILLLKIKRPIVFNRQYPNNNDRNHRR